MSESLEHSLFDCIDDIRVPVSEVIRHYHHGYGFQWFFHWDVSDVESYYRNHRNKQGEFGSGREYVHVVFVKLIKAPNG